MTAGLLKRWVQRAPAVVCVCDKVSARAQGRSREWHWKVQEWVGCCWPLMTAPCHRSCLCLPGPLQAVAVRGCGLPPGWHRHLPAGTPRAQQHTTNNEKCCLCKQPPTVVLWSVDVHNKTSSLHRGSSHSQVVACAQACQAAQPCCCDTSEPAAGVCVSRLTMSHFIVSMPPCTLRL